MVGDRWQWCFAHPEMAVVPVESIGPEGLRADCAEALERVGRFAQASVQLLSNAIVLYWQRSATLWERAPRAWFPPRAQHICIVRRGHTVRPYFQPIYNSSWLLYEDDFDPETSSIELAAYLLLHAERMAWRRQVLAAFEQNLSYWLARSDEEIADFRRGALRSTRPDAPALRALAQALPWIRKLYHPVLKPPVLTLPRGLVPLGASGMLAPRDAVAEWERLRQQWQRAAEKVVEGYYRTCGRAAKSEVEALCRWLRQERPDVLVVGKNMDVVWDPHLPDDTRRLRDFLAGSSAVAVLSLRADWETIDRHSRNFRQAAREPLPAEVAGVEASGLCFLWPNRPVIAYRLGEPGMDRLRLPAPPYERLMLGARTMHEWGHLASHAGWVGVPQERAAEWSVLCAQLEELCEQVVRDAPASIRTAVASEIERLAARGPIGRALADIVYTRMEDYRANVVARAFLSPLELETYVRNNVTCLEQSMRPTAVFQRLLRYAYEFQYLGLLALEDPWGYLCSSTWFDREFWSSGLVSRPLTERLFQCVAQMCALQTVDRSKLCCPEQGSGSSPRGGSECRAARTKLPEADR